MGSIALSGVQKLFYTIFGSRDKSKLNWVSDFKMFEYWTILLSWNLMPHTVFLLFWLPYIYRNGFELSACPISMSSLKWDVSKPSKMLIAREIMHKFWQDSRLFIIWNSDIWYPILFCLYLGSLILYRKVFVLQMNYVPLF